MVREEVKETNEIAGGKKSEEESAELEIETKRPKYVTSLGKKILSKEIENIDQVLLEGRKIKEEVIVDSLVSDLKEETIMLGQSKGKFGGGRRKPVKQTQKKTAEGNKPSFSTISVAGNYDGIVGVGLASARENKPALDKAKRRAKLNIIKIDRGCGSWQCTCSEPHSIPFKVVGRSGSVRATLIPAPKGTGIIAEKEISKIFSLAGIKDIWVNLTGQARRKENSAMAVFNALEKLSQARRRE